MGTKSDFKGNGHNTLAGCLFYSVLGNQTDDQQRIPAEKKSDNREAADDVLWKTKGPNKGNNLTYFKQMEIQCHTWK